ncbi:hypothetical protein CRENBAI_011574 [Crenichthys baileyi]|uniref:Uncharacterized protein n=1 Tax=Crenichthys baileyi TaxID=28760 RepID=A0AAV9SQ50_9TELE
MSFDPPSKHPRDTPACNPAPATTSPGRSRQQLLFRAVTPGFLVFFYSGSPSILPASFIPFMDSLQRSNYHPLLSFFRSSLPSLPRYHFLVSPLLTLNPFLGSFHCHFHRNAHPSSYLKVDHCVTSPDGCLAKFELSHLRFYQSPFRRAPLLPSNTRCWLPAPVSSQSGWYFFFYGDVVLLADSLQFSISSPGPKPAS